MDNVLFLSKLSRTAEKRANLLLEYFGVLFNDSAKPLSIFKKCLKMSNIKIYEAFLYDIAREKID